LRTKPDMYNPQINQLLTPLFDLMAKKLVVYDLAASDKKQTSAADDSGPLSGSVTDLAEYIALKDVARSVSVGTINSSEQLEDHNSSGEWSEKSTSKSVLLIGCSKSLILYDIRNKCNLFNLNTSTPIDVITNNVISTCIKPGLDPPIVCAGPQRLYALRLDLPLDGHGFSAELSSERSVSDTIVCLAQGNLGGDDLVLTGSVEGRIHIYQLDSLDKNVRSHSLTICENSQINNLCAINTSSFPLSRTNKDDKLEEVATDSGTQLSIEQMDHFAYGLDSGFIGVYRLIHTDRPRFPSNLTPARIANLTESVKPMLSSERLWRNKCKCIPQTMIMYDANGDGLDELVVGFKSGRLEARSPFTGQLLAATRCLKSGDRLAGLTVMDHHLDGRQMLLACSTSGVVIGFRPSSLSSARVALQGYSLVPVQRFPQTKTSHRNGNQEAELQGRMGWGAHGQSEGTRATIANGLLVAGRDFFTKDSVMVSDADLHIESVGDDMKPSKCDATQNGDLLQTLNALLAQQMELEQRACQLYHSNILQAQLFGNVGELEEDKINHKWDLDLETVSYNCINHLNPRFAIALLIVLKTKSKHLTQLYSLNKLIRSILD